MKVENYDSKKEAEEAEQFMLPAPGVYKVVVESAEDKVNVNGKPYTGFKFKIIDTEKIIFYTLYESSLMHRILFAMQRCFGVKEINDTETDFIGKVGKIVYTHKEWNGEKQGEINPFKGFLVKEEEEEEVGKKEETDIPF